MRKCSKINFSNGLRSILFLLSFSLCSLMSFSQSPTVTGKVTSSVDKSYLSGVSVIVKGTTNGTTTDLAGNYSINIGTNTPILIFSYTGFLDKEVNVGSQSTLNTQLQASTNNLDEVVVIGYGTQKKSDLTGSIGTVKSKELHCS